MHHGACADFDVVIKGGVGHDAHALVEPATVADYGVGVNGHIAGHGGFRSDGHSGADARRWIDDGAGVDPGAGVNAGAQPRRTLPESGSGGEGEVGVRDHDGVGGAERQVAVVENDGGRLGPGQSLPIGWIGKVGELARHRGGQGTHAGNHHIRVADDLAAHSLG